MTRRKAALLVAVSVALLAAGYAIAASSPSGYTYEEYDTPEEYEVEILTGPEGGFPSGWDQYAP